MFTRIIVPLDGSALAETVLQFVEPMAKGLRARVDLLRIVNLSYAFPYTPESYIGPEIWEQVLKADEAAARDYLRPIASRLAAAGIDSSATVVSGFPANTIIDTAGDDPSTLVAMTSHGRSGLARFALGSVAELVVRGLSTPVFLSRPLTKPPDVLDHIMATLDGSALSEKVLPAVESLAVALGASVTLLQVTRQGGEKQALPYLDAVAERLRAAGVTEVRTRATFEPVSEAIIDSATNLRADVIAMATHGRGGLGRWVLGSVADRVLHAQTPPVLLVRAKE
jgi:nucleotide-binding universal stress UspA family protein